MDDEDNQRQEVECRYNTFGLIIFFRILQVGCTTENAEVVGEKKKNNRGPCLICHRKINRWTKNAVYG